MRVALVMESSQMKKNGLIFKELEKTCAKFKQDTVNYGMYEDNNVNLIKYYQVGIISSILLEGGAADFVVTGCGTGQGAMISMNSFPNIVCGLVDSPLDAFLFSQVNSGNAISLRFAQNYGWGANLNCGYCFDALFQHEFGQGYPEELAESQVISRKAFVRMKQTMYPNIYEVLNRIGDDVVRNIINYPEFKTYFFRDAKNMDMIHYCRKILREE